jgi:peptide/nickel transport system permease protein
LRDGEVAMQGDEWDSQWDMLLALLGQATPTFWLGLILILVFAVDLGWLPTGGFDGPRSLVLPAITLGVFTTASIARLLRSDLLDVMKEDYVRTARAKGLTEPRIMLTHVMRNATIPILTNLAVALPGIFVGSFLIEVFFSIPGLGREVLLAVNRSDYPVIQAVTIYLAVITMVVNLATDVLYKLVDPRVVLR